MSGLNISCGSFRGNDKSGSAFEAVLDALDGAPSDPISTIKLGFDDKEHVLIPEEQAKILLPLLVVYWRHPVADIGHDDWTMEASAEDAAGLDFVKAKWGASRGWHLYCTKDLIRAGETSLAEHEPIAVMLC